MKTKERDDDQSGYVPGGNVLLARALLDGALWRWDSEHIRLWVYLLLSVNASDKVVTIGSVEVGYGQVLKSYRKVAEECEYTANNETVRWVPERVRRMLDRFRAAGMVSTVVTGLGTLVTVLNFEQYQDFHSYRRPGLGQGLRQARDNNNQSIHLNQQQHSLRGMVESLWLVWVEELGGKPPHPELNTGKRRELLATLYREQLKPKCAESGDDPAELFRRICRAVRSSDHHMSKREYHLPDSLFRNAERRERWTLDALSRGRASSGAQDRPSVFDLDASQ